MRAFSKKTNKIYMMASRGLFMCRVPMEDGVHGFGIGETMQVAYDNAIKHRKKLQQMCEPVKPRGKLWLGLIEMFKN